ncbi:hypothetical protein BD309DRAFT_137009 [Dichomitus squalens]|nr:hypothetical protein BD309DRAFT_137009 [Dichomitus squalens]
MPSDSPASLSGTYASSTVVLAWLLPAVRVHRTTDTRRPSVRRGTVQTRDMPLAAERRRHPRAMYTATPRTTPLPRSLEARRLRSPPRHPEQGLRLKASVISRGPMIHAPAREGTAAFLPLRAYPTPSDGT